MEDNKEVKTIGGKTFLSLNLVMALIGGSGGGALMSLTKGSEQASAQVYSRYEREIRELSRERLEQERRTNELFTEIRERLAGIEAQLRNK